MTRLGALAWFVLVLAAGFATFRVKYAVQDIDDQLHRVRKQTAAEQQEIRVLNAEWTYLNQPERLAELNQRFLRLQPIAVAQLRRTITDIPWRQPEAAPGTATVATAARTAPVQPEANPAPAPARAPPAARLAKATPDRLAVAKAAPRSLDALIERVAEAR